MANPSGMPSWIDLTTSDLDGAKAFYTDLFGWTTREFAESEAQGYTMFLHDGKPVAGAGPRRTSGEPSSWTMTVATDDAKAVAAKVEVAGGKVLLPPTDLLGYGRTAVFTDPRGAAFAVWQAGTHPGGEVFDEPGCYTWSELNTREPAGGKDFYDHVFGWTTTDRPAGAVTYSTFKLNGQPAAGLMPMHDGAFPADLPEHWLNYIAVDDCDASAEKIENLGGRVPVEPADIPPGRFAVAADPQGAHFAIIALNPDFQPT